MDIDTLTRIHSIGHGLQDVKMTFNHDMKIKVADVNVEAKQSEILNLPRWIGNVLSAEGIVETQDTDMVTELKQAIVKENVQGEFDLATLDPQFYIKLRSQMKTLDQTDFDRVESMLNSLIRKRQGKIIHLADSSKLNSDTAAKLTVEEREFYKRIYDTSVDFKDQILGDGKN